MINIDSRITPFDSSFETCEKCFARLMIFPDGNHPDEITNLLGISPSKINIAGERIETSRGTTRYVKYSAWFLSSEDSVDSKDLRDHIDWITEKLNSRFERWRDIQNMEGIKLTLKCVWLSKLGHGGPVLWPEQMKVLADLNLECAFDIYFPDELV